MFQQLFGKRVMFFYAPDGGGAGGGSDAGDGGDDSGAGGSSKQPKDANDGGKQSDKGDDDDDAKLQEKLNKLLPDRAKQYLQYRDSCALGFKSEKELTAALGDLKKRQDAEKTDLEKQAERVTELEKAVAQRDAVLKQDRIERSVEKAARGLKFRNPEDAILNLKNELEAAEVAEDGSIKGLEDMLKKLAKAKPYLIDDGDDKAPNIDAKTDSKKKTEQDEQDLRRRYGM